MKVEDGFTVVAIEPNFLVTENLNSRPVAGSIPVLSIS